jgi:4-amino-4-deoxy-L-arabinose transferase-like glycosyltransferase
VADGLDLLAAPRARGAVILAAAVLVLARLGAADLWPPDEPRYALVAEEVRSFEHGLRGLVLLHLHGEPYTQKPPLYYWLAAAAGAPFGRVDEVAARLPSALAGVATVALVIALGTLLAGRGAGTLAGLLLVTTFDWSWTARTVQLDTLLACCETAALVAFWRIETGTGSRRANLAALHAALGLAVLTKGPVGFVVPFLAIAAYLAWERRLAALPGLLHPAGLALSLGPALAWTAGAVALGPRGFFDAAVVQNVFGRLGAGAAHAQPFHYYLEKFPPDILPWLLLLPAAIVAGRRALGGGADTDERRSWRFLVAWIATTLLLFSVTPAKRLRYLLPIEPAFALLFALALQRWLGPRGARRLAFGAVGIWMAQLVAYAVVLPARLDPERSPRPIAAAARSLAGDDGPIGLYRAADLANGIAYYGARRVEAFRDPARIARFAADGGRVLVLEDVRLAEVERLTPIDVRGRYRVGGETWLVAVVGGD